MRMEYLEMPGEWELPELYAINLITGTNVGSHIIVPAAFLSGSEEGGEEVQFDSRNFEITYNLGELTILPAPLTFTAKDTSMVYGDTQPEYSVTADGLVYDETMNDVVAEGFPTYSIHNGDEIYGTEDVVPAGILDIVPDVKLREADFIVSDEYDDYSLYGLTNSSELVNYTVALVNGSLSVEQSEQTITFEALEEKTYGDASFDLIANSSSGLDITFSSTNTDVATIEGNTVTIISAGTTEIVASQAGNENFIAAENVTQTLTIRKADQIITLDPATPTEVTFGDEPFDLSATSNSVYLLGVTFASSNPDVLSIEGNRVIIVSAGDAIITASQAGDANHNAAESVAQFIVVHKSTQTISFDALTSPTFGDDPYALVATSTSGLPVTFESSDNTVATISGTTITIFGAGTTTISATQIGDDDYLAAATVAQTLSVNKASQAISFDALPSPTFGDDPISLTATSTSGLPVTFESSDLTVATISGTTVTIVGAGVATITASQAGDDDYLEASPVRQTLTVAKAAQSISFDALSSVTYGDGSFELVATASPSGFEVAFESSDLTVATISGTTVTIVGAGVATITASQAGDDDYLAASPVLQTLTVNQAAQSISFNALSSPTYGDGPIVLVATSTSGLPVAFESSTESVASISGNTLTINGAGTTTISALQIGDGNYTSAGIVFQTLTVNRAEQSISFDAIPTSTYGDGPIALSASASSSLPVSYESSNESVASISGNTVTIQGAGSATITASQTGDNNYDPASENQVLTVGEATLTVTALDKVINAGDMPVVSFIYDGFVNGDNEGNVFGGSPGYSINPNYSGSAGTYSIIPMASALNYDITNVAGELFVNPYGPGTRAVKPSLDCITKDKGVYTAHFVYKNDNDYDVFVPIGADNIMIGGGLTNQPQPEMFYSGGGTFSVEFDGSQLSWTVSSIGEGHKVSMSTNANSFSKKCNFNKSLDLSQEEEPIESIVTMRAYPNPTSDLVYVELSNNSVSVKSIVVFDSYGKIYSIEPNSVDHNIQVDLTGVNPGLYFIKVTLDDNKEEILRVIKQ